MLCDLHHVGLMEHLLVFQEKQFYNELSIDPL